MEAFLILPIARQIFKRNSSVFFINYVLKRGNLHPEILIGSGFVKNPEDLALQLVGYSL